MLQDQDENQEATHILVLDDASVYQCESVTPTALPAWNETESDPITQARHRIRMLVREGNVVSELAMPTAERLVLGRASPSSPHQPNIDLTDFNAAQMGVSRLHAIIEDHDNIFTITDLYSSNGTFLNGRRLAPHEIRFVHHGDTICLGKLVLYVRMSELLDE